MKRLLFILFVLFSCNLFSQGVSNLWLMGYASWAGPPYGGTNFDFSGGTLNISYQSRLMNFEETNGVICDKNGNFLFSSNGVYIANAQNQIMVNGSGLNPAFYTNETSHDSLGLALPQGNLIIPFPNDSTKYYLFHETCDDYGNSYCSFFLYYSVIDMSLDNGLGVVVQKNTVLLSDSLVEGRLTACKHANGRDWWLITHQINTNNYFTFLITPDGIDGPYMQGIGSEMSIWGQSVFSPDGKYFAYYNTISAIQGVGNLDIYDFDRCTGGLTLKTQIILDSVYGAGGVAFSPNSNVLYASSNLKVYQFDMTDANILGSKTTVAIYDGFYSPNPPLTTHFYLSQLAPDGKIYINCTNSTVDIHVINYPDSLGLGCDVCQHCIHLPAFNAFTIANHPNYFLGADSGSICDSLTSTEEILSNKIELKIYPNPIADNQEITFTYPSIGDKTFLVVNNTEGKEVIHYELPQWSSVQHLKLPKLSSGIYLARIVSKNVSGNAKFIVE
jgi:hypothetical protein